MWLSCMVPSTVRRRITLGGLTLVSTMSTVLWPDEPLQSRVNNTA